MAWAMAGTGAAAGGLGWGAAATGGLGAGAGGVLGEQA